VKKPRDSDEVELDTTHEREEYRIALKKITERKPGVEVKEIVEWRDSGTPQASRFFAEAHIQACEAVVKALKRERADPSALNRKDSLRMLDKAHKRLEKARQLGKPVAPGDAGIGVVSGAQEPDESVHSEGAIIESAAQVASAAEAPPVPQPTGAAEQVRGAESDRLEPPLLEGDYKVVHGTRMAIPVDAEKVKAVFLGETAERKAYAIKRLAMETAGIRTVLKEMSSRQRFLDPDYLYWVYRQGEPLFMFNLRNRFLHFERDGLGYTFRLQINPDDRDIDFRHLLSIGMVGIDTDRKLTIGDLYEEFGLSEARHYPNAYERKEGFYYDATQAALRLIDGIPGLSRWSKIDYSAEGHWESSATRIHLEDPHALDGLSLVFGAHIHPPDSSCVISEGDVSMIRDQQSPEIIITAGQHYGVIWAPKVEAEPKLIYDAATRALLESSGFGYSLDFYPLNIDLDEEAAAAGARLTSKGDIPAVAAEAAKSRPPIKVKQISSTSNIVREDFIDLLGYASMDELVELYDATEGRYFPSGEMVYKLLGRRDQQSGRQIVKDRGNMSKDGRYLASVTCRGEAFIEYGLWSAEENISLPRLSWPEIIGIMREKLSGKVIEQKGVPEYRDERDTTRLKDLLGLILRYQDLFSEAERGFFANLFEPWSDTREQIGYIGRYVRPTGRRDRPHDEPHYVDHIFESHGKLGVFKQGMDALYRYLWGKRNDDLLRSLAKESEKALLPEPPKSTTITAEEFMEAKHFAEEQIDKMRGRFSEILAQNTESFNSINFDEVIREKNASFVGYVGQTQNLQYQVMADYITFKRAGLNPCEAGRTLNQFLDDYLKTGDLPKIMQAYFGRSNFQADFRPIGDAGFALIACWPSDTAVGQNHVSPFYGPIFPRFGDAGSFDYWIKNSKINFGVRMNNEQIRLLADFGFLEGQVYDPRRRKWSDLGYRTRASALVSLIKGVPIHEVVEVRYEDVEQLASAAPQPVTQWSGTEPMGDKDTPGYRKPEKNPPQDRFGSADNPMKGHGFAKRMKDDEPREVNAPAQPPAAEALESQPAGGAKMRQEPEKITPAPIAMQEAERGAQSELENYLVKALPNLCFLFKEKIQIGYLVDTATQKRAPYEAVFAALTPGYASTRRLAYVRIGNWRFVDHRLKPYIEPLLTGSYEKYKESIIYLYELMGSLKDYKNNLPDFVGPMILAIDSLDLKGREVIDFGAAEGLLSLVAMRKGAIPTLVEIDPQHEKIFRKNLRLNHLNRRQYRYIVGDINKKPELLEKLGQMRPYAIFANMGEHPGYAKGTHLKAISYLDNFPTVEFYLPGGYGLGFVPMATEDLLTGQLQIHRPQDVAFSEAMNALARRGFQELRRYHHEYEPEALSWAGRKTVVIAQHIYNSGHNSGDTPHNSSLSSGTSKDAAAVKPHNTDRNGDVAFGGQPVSYWFGRAGRVTPKTLEQFVKHLKLDETARNDPATITEIRNVLPPELLGTFDNMLGDVSPSHTSPALPSGSSTIILNGKEMTFEEAKREIDEVAPDKRFLFNARITNGALKIGITKRGLHSYIKSPSLEEENVFRGGIAAGQISCYPFKEKGLTSNEKWKYHDDLIIIARCLIKLGFPPSIILDTTMQDETLPLLLFQENTAKTIGELAGQRLLLNGEAESATLASAGAPAAEAPVPRPADGV
ncbi:MAG: hypothetical protein Q7S07_00800, partial [Candidatus Omnitrophota bacterium]|nr:hypothetical protein [Candidatus Omnitrophota bacterium]